MQWDSGEENLDCTWGDDDVDEEEVGREKDIASGSVSVNVIGRRERLCERM